MARKHSDETLLKFLKEHVRYERMMIRHVYKELHQQKDQLIWNALYESFGVHARNLYKFLRSDDGGNIGSNSYVANRSKPEHEPLFNMLDIFLFHMAVERDRKDRLNKENLKVLAAWIDREWKIWTDQLGEPFKLEVDREPIVTPETITIAAGVPTACSVVDAVTVTMKPQSK